jgi:uncharacterized YkwD family protein
MKKKIIALITTLLVCGSVGAYASAENTANTSVYISKLSTASAADICTSVSSGSVCGFPVLCLKKTTCSADKTSSSQSSTASAAASVKKAQASTPCSSSAKSASASSCSAQKTDGAETCKSSVQNIQCAKADDLSSCLKSISGNSCNNEIVSNLYQYLKAGKCTQPSSSSSSKSSSKVSQPSAPAKSSSSATTSSQAPSAGSSYSAFQNEVVRLVNQERAKNGLGALSVDSALTKTATLKSQDMAENGYFSHTSPTYGSPFDMMKQFGITYRTAGENIAMGQTTPAQVMEGWMNSPGHRANILQSSYTKIGVGVAQNSAGRYYWTQQFIG